MIRLDHRDPLPESLRGAFLLGDAAIEKYRVVALVVGLVAGSASLWTIDAATTVYPFTPIATGLAVSQSDVAVMVSAPARNVHGHASRAACRASAIAVTATKNGSSSVNASTPRSGSPLRNAKA